MMHSKSTSTERREHTAVIYGPLNLLLQSQNIYSVTWLLMNISLCICSSTDLKTSIHISIFRETERERMKQNATKPTKKHLIKTESFKAHSTTHLTVLQSVSFLSVLILSLFSVCELMDLGSFRSNFDSWRINTWPKIFLSMDHIKTSLFFVALFECVYVCTLYLFLFAFGILHMRLWLVVVIILLVKMPKQKCLRRKCFVIFKHFNVICDSLEFKVF